MSVSPGVLYTITVDRASWTAKGRTALGLPADPPPVDRTTLQLEVDRPVPGVNVGVYPESEKPRNAPITPANNGLYEMTVGQILEDVDVYGRLKVRDNCIVRNVRVWGTPPDANPGTNDHLPLIELPSGTTGALIEDCTLIPDPAYESDQVYSIKGRGFTARRCVMGRAVDSVQIWSGDATFEMCWFGDPYLADPDRTRSDGQATHNDVAGQLQGGNGTITYQGCVMDAFLPNYTDWMSTANSASLFALLVTDDAKVNDVRTAPDVIRLYGNWIRGGSYPVNISTGAEAVETNGWVECSILRNRIEKGHEKDGGGDGWHAIASTTLVQPYWSFPTSGADANVDVIVSGTGADQTWTATGNPIRIKAG